MAIKWLSQYQQLHWKLARLQLFKVTQVATLKQVAYSTVREAIINKLGEKANTFVGELQI